LPVDVTDQPATLQNLPVLRASVTDKDQVLVGDSGDNSNTQFAVLAVLAARRHGIPLDRTLALIAHRFRTGQSADGGWRYGYRDASYASMTCAGLLGTAVGLGLRNEVREKAGHRPTGTDPAKTPAVQKGIEYLSKNAVGQPTKRWTNLAMPNLYTLWSIER